MHKFLLFIFSICLFSCGQTKTSNILVLNIIDLKSDFQEFMTVNIYKSFEDWQQEQNPVQTAKISDKKGEVRFFDLDLPSYFIDIQKDSISNWDSKNEVKLNLQGSSFSINQQTIIVKSSKKWLLSKAIGKKWLLDEAIASSGPPLSTTSIENILPCLKLGNFVFLKSGKLIKNCDKGGFTEGTWQINTEETVLNVIFSTTTLNFTIKSLNSKEMVLQIRVAGRPIDLYYLATD